MSPQTRRLLRGTGVAVAVTGVLGAVALASLRVAGANDTATAPLPGRISTATVTKKTLVDSITVEGTIAYGAQTPVTSRATGTITWLPDPGTVLTRGTPVLRADDKPVVLLYGPLPMYRELALTAEGDDVTQLKNNLREMSLGGVTKSATFDEATETLVKKWQKSLKREETGRVAIGDVVYAAGPVRVARHGVRLGAAAGSDVLTVTATGRVVTLSVPRGKERLARPGNAVTVTLADGKKVPGKVTDVGPNAAPAGPSARDGQDTAPAGTGDSSGEAQESRVPAVVEVADQNAFGATDSGTVTVDYVAATRADVLTVPVEALVALAEGGFGLEIRGSGPPHVVAVTVGLFGGGQVEVTGNSIADGTTVGVAG